LKQIKFASANIYVFTTIKTLKSAKYSVQKEHVHLNSFQFYKSIVPDPGIC